MESATIFFRLCINTLHKQQSIEKRRGPRHADVHMMMLMMVMVVDTDWYIYILYSYYNGLEGDWVHCRMCVCTASYVRKCKSTESHSTR